MCRSCGVAMVRVKCVQVLCCCNGQIGAEFIRDNFLGSQNMTTLIHFPFIYILCVPLFLDSQLPEIECFSIKLSGQRFTWFSEITLTSVEIGNRNLSLYFIHLFIFYFINNNILSLIS